MLPYKGKTGSDLWQNENSASGVDCGLEGKR